MKLVYSMSLAVIILLAGTVSGAAPKKVDVDKSVVLVHGAFADGSSWSQVIGYLQSKGIKATAVQNPLTSLADDVTFAKRVINNQTGKVVLVGHSWGGMVITEAGMEDKVAALVYVAAFAPSKGESAINASSKFVPAPGLAFAKPDSSGYLYLNEEGFEKHFAQDLPAAQTKVMQAVQGPLFGGSFNEVVTNAAWETKPSWYIVAENDHMINPDLQRDFATKLSAKVTSLPTSHVPMLVKPEAVGDVIIEALNSIK